MKLEIVSDLVADPDTHVKTLQYDRMETVEMLHRQISKQINGRKGGRTERQAGRHAYKRSRLIQKFSLQFQLLSYTSQWFNAFLCPQKKRK